MPDEKREGWTVSSHDSFLIEKSICLGNPSEWFDKSPHPS
jgi:hypothetical protein